MSEAKGNRITASLDEGRNDEQRNEPIEDIWVSGEDLGPGDAYREGAYVVFTAQYHRRRGFCCHSGCRHCPFREPEIAAKSSVLPAPADDLPRR